MNAFLAKWLAFELLAIRVENLKFVNARGPVIRVAPDDFFIARDFGETSLTCFGAITGNDRIAVGESLHTARIFDGLAFQIIIRDLPNYFRLGIELNDHVAIGASDESVAIGQPNRGERPIGRRSFPNNLAGSRVFSND